MYMGPRPEFLPGEAPWHLTAMLTPSADDGCEERVVRIVFDGMTAANTMSAATGKVHRGRGGEGPYERFEGPGSPCTGRERIAP